MLIHTGVKVLYMLLWLGEKSQHEDTNIVFRCLRLFVVLLLTCDYDVRSWYVTPVHQVSLLKHVAYIRYLHRHM